MRVWGRTETRTAFQFVGDMAISLISLVTEFLTPTMIGRIASALGVDRNKLQTAVNAAVPGLLAGLTGVAAEPGGAQKLVDAAGAAHRGI